MFFKQEISQNTYGELLPPDGKYDYTIILSGHTDTSWCWRHSAHASKFKKTKPDQWALLQPSPRLGFGVICFLSFTAVSISHDRYFKRGVFR